MASAIYTIQHKGHDIQIEAPENANPSQLRAAADAAVSKLQTAPAPSADVPMPSGFVRPPTVGPADPQKKSFMAAFREGFAEPRKNDPFGINPENRGKVAFGMYDRAGDVVRGGLEIAESLYGGVKRGTGQAIYNSGLSQSSPRVTGDRAFEPIEFASLMAGANPAGLFRAAAIRPPVPLPAAPNNRMQLQALADRHGVDLLPADVGGPIVRGLTAGSRQTILGEHTIGNAATRSNDQMANAVNVVAGQQGRVRPAVDVGRGLQEGARNYSRRTSTLGGQLYDNARAAAGNVRFDPQRAVAHLDTEIARLMESRAADAPEILALQAYRDRLTRQGGLSFEGITQIISDAKSAGRTDDLRNTDVGRIMGGVGQRAAEDVDVGLTLAGRNRAATLYRRANAFWRGRAETVDDALEPILGAGKSGEDALAGIQAMAQGGKGGSRRLSRVLSSMPAQAANDARATIISRLGMANAGQQGADGATFSTSTFLTNWSKMSPEGRRALFGNNPVVMQHLDDIARLAEGKKATAAYANTSNSGRAINQAQVMGRVGEGATLAAAGHFGGLSTVLTVAALDAGGGMLLGSPAFARILAGAPRTAGTTAQRQRIVRTLSALAVRQPGLQPYLDQVTERISAPAPPPLDYTKMGEGGAGDVMDLTKLSDAELQALYAQYAPMEDDTQQQQPVTTPLADEQQEGL